jgi:ATP-dependent helicase STH1/SNF2
VCHISFLFLDLASLPQRVNFLRKNPLEQKSPGELDGLIKYIQLLSSQGWFVSIVY